MFPLQPEVMSVVTMSLPESTSIYFQPTLLLNTQRIKNG